MEKSTAEEKPTCVTITIPLKKPVHCPTCGRSLDPAKAWYVAGLAHCEPCASRPESPIVGSLSRILLQALPRQTFTIRGLLFYSPRYQPAPCVDDGNLTSFRKELKTNYPFEA